MTQSSSSILNFGRFCRLQCRLRCLQTFSNFSGNGRSASIVNRRATGAHSTQPRASAHAAGDECGLGTGRTQQERDRKKKESDTRAAGNEIPVTELICEAEAAPPSVGPAQSPRGTVERSSSVKRPHEPEPSALEQRACDSHRLSPVGARRMVVLVLNPKP